MQTRVDQLNQLNGIEWNQIVTARVQAFIVEPMRPFQIFDDKETDAYHLRLLTDKNQLIGYARLYLQASMGAILDQLLIVPDYRGQGLGRQLVKMALFTSRRLFPARVLSAITYEGMEPFLETMNFHVVNHLTKGRVQLQQNL